MTTTTFTAKDWFVGLGNPGELRELRLFKRDSKDKLAGYFDDVDAMVAVTNKYSDEWSIYATLNPVNPHKLEPKPNKDPNKPPRTITKNQLFKPYEGDLTGNDDILSIDNIPIDADPVKAEGHEWNVLTPSWNGLNYRVSTKITI
jgi:hypothetical protein